MDLYSVGLVLELVFFAVDVCNFIRRSIGGASRLRTRTIVAGNSSSENRSVSYTQISLHTRYDAWLYFCRCEYKSCETLYCKKTPEMAYTWKIDINMFICCER